MVFLSLAGTQEIMVETTSTLKGEIKTIRVEINLVFFVVVVVVVVVVVFVSLGA